MFEVESGIIAGWYARCVETHPTELFPYHWDAVGQPAARIVYGKGSGIASVQWALAEMGIDLDEDECREVLADIKARGLASKSLLPREEIAGMVQRRPVAPVAR